MPELHPFLAEISRVALAVAQQHGFALGGGNALVLHGVVDRPTEDVDLFTDDDGDVHAAAALVREALHAAGLTVIDEPDESILSDVIYGFDDAMVQLRVQCGNDIAELSLSCLYRAHSPITMDIGPVMHLDDLIASKVAALISRREVRDYVDVGAFLARRTPGELLAMARTVDPGLESDDVVMVAEVLDRIPDRAFTRYAVGERDVAELRQRFAAWPRSPQQLSS
jgi:hypothetical protein